MSAELATVLRAYADRDLPEWVSLGGLPEGVPLEAVAANLGADPTVFVRWFLGDPPRETFWCPATVKGYDGRVKIWFRGGAVVKLEGEWPELSPDAIEALGTPDLRLDYQWDTMMVPGGEQVWASRGLAVRLNSSGNLAVGLSAFSATTPAGYRESLQGNDDYRESPDPGAGEYPE
jgi:hypothetical protein